MIIHSRIKSLIEYLDFVALNVEKFRAQRRLIEVEALLEMVEAKEDMNRNRRKSLMGDIAQSFSIFNQQIDTLNEFLEDSASEYRNI